MAAAAAVARLRPSCRSGCASSSRSGGSSSCRMRAPPHASLGSCCVTGSLDAGQPRGTEVALAGVSCYLAQPQQPNGCAVVIASDVLGWKLPNTRLIADAFAAAGYICAVPDYFVGGGLPPTLLDAAESAGAAGAPPMQRLQGALQLPVVMVQMVALLARNPVSRAVAITKAVADALRQQHGAHKVAVQGYCYGGKVGVLLAAEPQVVDAVAVAHPSTVKVPDDIAAMSVPSLFLCAASDGMFPPQAVEAAQQVLQAKPGIVSRFVTYPGTTHGFAVRGSKTDDVVRAARDDALRQAVHFFHEVLLSCSGGGSGAGGGGAVHDSGGGSIADGGV